MIQVSRSFHEIDNKLKKTKPNQRNSKWKRKRAKNIYSATLIHYLYNKIARIMASFWNAIKIEIFKRSKIKTDRFFYNPFLSIGFYANRSIKCILFSIPSLVNIDSFFFIHYNYFAALNKTNERKREKKNAKKLYTKWIKWLMLSEWTNMIFAFLSIARPMNKNYLLNVLCERILSH